MRTIRAGLSVLLLVAAVGEGADCGASGAAEVTVRLFSPGITWRVPVGTRVDGRLLEGERLLGTASAVAGAEGAAQLWFLATEEAERPYAVIEPGMSIELASSRGAPLHATVPVLYVDLDADGDRIGGISEPDATVLVTLVDPTGATRFEGAVAAADSGVFELDLRGEVDVTPGYRGLVALEQGSLRFESSLAAFEAEVDLDTGRVSGAGVSGIHVRVDVLDGQSALRGQGFATVEQATPVDGENDWSVSVRGPGGAPTEIVSGDRLVVARVDSPLAGGAGALDVAVPTLSIDFDLETQAIWGRSPHGGAATLSITRPDGQSEQAAITPDVAGAWSLHRPFEAGSRLQLTLAVRPDLRLCRGTSVEQLRLALYTSAWMAVGEPGKEVRLALLDTSGGSRAVGSCVPTADAEAYCHLGDETGPQALIPGNRLAATLGSGRQVTLTLPRLTARADVRTDTVSGEAPPGSVVDVVAEAEGRVLRREVTTDAQGRFAVAWGQELDLDSGAAGSAQLVLSGGHRAIVQWVVARLQVPLYASSLWAEAPVGRVVTATVTSPDGALAAVAAADTRFDFALLRSGAAPAARVRLELRPQGSRSSGMRPGDIVGATIGDASVRLEVPELELRAEPEADLVTGQTLPEAAVRLTVNRGRDATADVRADRRGAFAWQVREHDLVGGDLLQATVHNEQGHAVYRTVRAPYLRLGLHDGVVTAYVDPFAAATVVLRGRQGVRATAGAVADRNGLLAVVLRDADERRLLPDPDDELVANWGAADDARRTAMVVPELLLDWDLASDRVRGHARPWPQLEWLEVSVQPRRTSGTTDVPAAGADGAWALDLTGRVDLAPGTRIEATLRDRGGNLALRRRHVPLVRAPHGGGRVEGLADPLQVVTATLRGAGGALLAEGAGSASETGDWSLVLAGGHDTPPTATGQVVAVGFGTETIEVGLPRFDVAPDWGRGMIAGFGPADGAIEVRGSAGCRPRDPRRSEFVQWPAVRTGADGSLSVVGDFTRGDKVTLTHLTEAAQEVYVLLLRPLALVDVAAGAVFGCTSPFTTVHTSLHAEDGALRDRREAIADHDGAFRLSFVGPNGAPLAVSPTDSLIIEADGEQSRIPSAHVWVEIVAGSTIVGQALPDRPYVLELLLVDGRTEWLELAAGSGGQLTFTDVERRNAGEEDWSLSDVDRVAVYAESVSGHYLVATSAPAIRPRSPNYLPHASR